MGCVLCVFVFVFVVCGLCFCFAVFVVWCLVFDVSGTWCFLFEVLVGHECGLVWVVLVVSFCVFLGGWGFWIVGCLACLLLEFLLVWFRCGCLGWFSVVLCLVVWHLWFGVCGLVFIFWVCCVGMYSGFDLDLCLF